MTERARIDAREIRAMLQAPATLDRLLGNLFPQYQIATPVMTPLNPTRHDNRPGSFVVWTRGAAAGGFNEYSPNGPPAKGDVIDLIAYVNRSDRKFAFAFARDFLGLGKMTPAELALAHTVARQAALDVHHADSEAIAYKRRLANDLWAKTVPIAGSIAETYLASRRIPLVLIPNLEKDLRFLPRLEHWKSARWEGKRKLEDGPHLPAMVAAVRNGAGDVTGVHCTFLRQDGSGKADVTNAKLMRGIVKGGAVRIARGPSELTPEEAAEHGVIGPLILAEGIETALSCALAVPEARVWAATGFNFFEFAPIDHPCVDSVVIAADNDDDPKADEQLADVVDLLGASGKSVTIMRAHAGKDFNDLMRRED